MTSSISRDTSNRFTGKWSARDIYKEISENRIIVLSETRRKENIK